MMVPNLCLLTKISTLFLILAFFIGCVSKPNSRPGYNRQTGRATNKGQPVKRGATQTGIASYYGPGFHGKKTANGERFDQNAMTAAHRTHPFGTKLKVTLLSTGKSVVVRINDRGPFKKGRILDLSLGAAKKLGLIKFGTGKVTLQVL